MHLRDYNVLPKRVFRPWCLHRVPGTKCYTHPRQCTSADDFRGQHSAFPGQLNLLPPLFALREPKVSTKNYSNCHPDYQHTCEVRCNQPHHEVPSEWWHSIHSDRHWAGNSTNQPQSV